MASASRISGDHEDVGLTNLCKSEDEKEEDSTDGSETLPVTNGKILNKEKSNSSTSVNFEKVFFLELFRFSNLLIVSCITLYNYICSLLHYACHI